MLSPLILLDTFCLSQTVWLMPLRNFFLLKCTSKATIIHPGPVQFRLQVSLPLLINFLLLLNCSYIGYNLLGDILDKCLRCCMKFPLTIFLRNYSEQHIRAASCRSHLESQWETPNFDPPVSQNYWGRSSRKLVALTT